MRGRTVNADRATVADIEVRVSTFRPGQPEVVDDIAEGVVRVLDRPAAADPAFDPARPDPARSNSPYRVFNIGNSDPVRLMDFIESIEQSLGKPALKNFMPLQDGDVPATFAEVTELTGWTGFKPATPVREGVARFVSWYRSYYGA